MATKNKKPGLSQKFDVVAVYDIDDEKDVSPVSYLSVLSKLKKGTLDPFFTRDPFFMKDMAAALAPSYPIDKAREPLAILTGTDKSGLRMTAVQVTHEGIPTYLAMLEDTKTRKLLVVGPQAVAGADSWKEMTYVNAELYNKNKAKTQINEFLADAARYRGESIDGARNLLENVVKAAFILADLNSIAPDRVIPASTTLGDCLVEIAGGDTDMAAYTIAGKKAKHPKPGK